ncbi:MAG: SIR2 family protein [Xenococcaceae cyanobacterium MO_188.B29]|nr:SIR2 family protein [Xenococcaceae cyanobacterium MO_188.B29]
MTEGIIVTFYSYKGGVGRTLALANVGVLLSQWGYKVLCVDWDLEAPGLHFYYEHWIEQNDSPGVIELIQAYVNGETPDWKDFTTQIRLPSSAEPLNFIKAGVQDENYKTRLQSLNWQDLYEQKDLGLFLEKLRETWKQEFDFILIDSRTGITDIGGICTIQFPDILAVFFTINKQNLRGIIDSVNGIIQSRDGFPFDRARLLILPILTRYETSEKTLGKKGLRTFAKEFEPFYQGWIHRNLNAYDLLDLTKIPYITYWSFWEGLPVIEEGTQSPQDIGYALETLTAVIANKLAESELLVRNRYSFVQAARGETVSSVEVVPRIKSERASFSEKVALERHYEEIIDTIINGSLVLFLGPDVNLCDRPVQAGKKSSKWQPDQQYAPTESELAAYLVETFGLKEDFSKITLPPIDTPEIWDEVSLWLDCAGIDQGAFQRMPLPEYGRLAALKQGEWQLQAELSKFYYRLSDNSYLPNRLHRLIARLPELYCSFNREDFDSTRYPLIVTTCLDSTLEKAFIGAKQPFDLVFYVNGQQRFAHQRFDPGIDGNWDAPIDKTSKAQLISQQDHTGWLNDRPVILKLYGSVAGFEDRKGNFMITEDDLLNYLVLNTSDRFQLPEKLLVKLINSHFLFLGYSLSYWNQRAILKTIRSNPNYPRNFLKSWAIQASPGILEDYLWEKDSVELISGISLENYVVELEMRLENLFRRRL